MGLLYDEPYFSYLTYKSILCPTAVETETDPLLSKLAFIPFEVCTLITAPPPTRVTAAPVGVLVVVTSFLLQFKIFSLGVPLGEWHRLNFAIFPANTVTLQSCEQIAHVMTRHISFLPNFHLLLLFFIHYTSSDYTL